MKGAIGIVYFQMRALCAIYLYMDSVEGHRLALRAPNIWLVHVVPEAIHVITAFEDIVGEEISPIVLSVGVQEVYPR